MSRYTKIMASTPESERANINKKALKTSANKHTNFGHIDDPSKSLPIDPDLAKNFGSDVVALAGQLKYQHEHDGATGIDDGFYLLYACNQLNRSYDGKFTNSMLGVDPVPDAAYAEYSYEEIIAMANNGVNIPQAVLAWAKAQQEADVVDYVVISDNMDYNDDFQKDKSTGVSEINKIRSEVKDFALKSQKSQEDIGKIRQKTSELTAQAADIAKEQKSIINANSLDETEQMVKEWKELDNKKKDEGKLGLADNIKYNKLSEKLQKNGKIIKDIKKNSTNLDNFLDSIDLLNEENNNGMINAEKTINAAVNMSNLDDRLNTMVKVHAYKIADKSSGMLEDTLSKLDDSQLIYVASKIGYELEDLSRETFEEINNDNTQEVVKFADEYITKAKNIENTLGIDIVDDQNEKVDEKDNAEEETTVAPEEEVTVAPEEEVTVAPEEEPLTVARTRGGAFEEEPTVAPEEEVTVAPEEEVTVAPEEEVTVAPEEEVTVAPEEEVTVAPEEEVTAAPEEEVTVAPEEEVTVAPEEEVTVAPEEETTVAPEEEEVTVAPEEEVTVAPEEEVTVAPEEEVTVAPEEEVTVAPEEEVTVAPEEEVTVAPEEEVTVAPEEEVTVAPEEEVTVAPEEEVTVAPEEGVTVAPEEEVTVAPEEEVTVAPEEEVTVAPEEEVTVAPEEDIEQNQKINNLVEEEPTAVPVQPLTDETENTPQNSEEEPFTVARTRGGVFEEEPTVAPEEEPTVASEEETTIAPEEETTVAPIEEQTVAPEEETTVAPEEEHIPTDKQPVKNKEDLKELVTSNVAMGKQPQDIKTITVTVPQSTTSASSTPVQKTRTNETKTTKTETKDSQTEKKEKVVDAQAQMKDAYGDNKDFAAMVVAHSIVDMIALGPIAFTFDILKFAAIAGMSILDLFSKEDTVSQSGKIAEKDTQTSADAAKALVSKSNEIKAQHDKYVAEAKRYGQEFKALNDDSINYQFASMQEQKTLIEAGRMTEDEIIEYQDPNAGAKSSVRAMATNIERKDAKLLAGIGAPKAKAEKVTNQSMKSVIDFDNLNEKLTERNDNNDKVGDIIITEAIIAQGLITSLVAALMACGPWCWGLAVLWLEGLALTATYSASGVAAKLASDKVEDKINENDQNFIKDMKSLSNDQKKWNDVDKVMAKANLDKINYLPKEEENSAPSIQTEGNENNQNGNNGNPAENNNNNQVQDNPYVSYVRKDSETRSGFDKSSFNAELDINKATDVKKANEYAKAYTRDVNDADEKSKAAASSTNASTQSDTTKADVKLARFNKDGAIDSKRRSQKVNAASASSGNGRRRR